METEELQRTKDAQAFITAMLNYVFPRRFHEQKIPRFDETNERQAAEVHFQGDIGEAVLLLCHINGNSFLNTFLSDYPEYLSDMRTFVKYCTRLALQLYNEENIMNSLLMVSSMIIEMVSYCLKPNVENGMLFVNSADECWLSIFKGQFEKAFFISGGWKSLQEASEEKARIYEKIKSEYPSFSDKNVQFQYWIGDKEPETPEIFELEAGYWRIKQRINEIIQSDIDNQILLQEVLDSDDSELESDAVQPGIYVSGSEHTSTHETDEFLSELHKLENKDLKCSIAEKSCDSASQKVQKGMEVDDSNIEREKSSETGSKELCTASKATQKTCETSANFSLDDSSSENAFVAAFKEIAFYANSLDALYLHSILGLRENIDILMSNDDYLMLMKDCVDNPGKEPDIRKLVDEARKIIMEATSPRTVRKRYLERQQTDNFTKSSVNLEQNVDMQNLQKTPEKDNLTPAETSLKKFVEAARRTLKAKQSAEYLITERRNFQRSAMKPEYIEQVLQHLNSKFDNVLPVTDKTELEDLDFPFTKQGTPILMELMIFSHTLTNRIQIFLETFPSSFVKRHFDKYLAKLDSGKEGIRIAMATLGCSLTLQDISLSQYYTELLKALIGECASFLRLENELKKVEIKAVGYSTGTRPKRNRVRKYRTQSTSQSSTAEVLPECSTDVDNRKRRKNVNKTLFDCQTSKYVDSTSSDSSNSPKCVPKRPRLPLDETESPEQVTEKSSWAENVKQSSDSEENKY